MKRTAVDGGKDIILLSVEIVHPPSPSLRDTSPKGRGSTLPPSLHFIRHLRRLRRATTDREERSGSLFCEAFFS